MWVLGNGESRQQVNVKNLKGIKIGCNAIIRDYKVDHLICVDRRMVEEAIGYNTKIYTRKDWLSTYKNFNVMHVPDLIHQGKERLDEPFHWGSGPYAVLLATFLSKYIKLIGFDLYGIDGKLNNVYENTSGYLKNTDDQVDWSYWEYQLAKIFELNQDKTFHIYNLEDWKLPKQWNFSNIKVDNIVNL